MPETPTPKDYEDLKKDPYDKQKDLQDLTKEIDDLKDDKDQNDIIENNVVLNNALNGKIQEYLKNNEKVTELIVAELDKIIKNPETSDSARKSAESLLNLIKSIQSTEERPEDPETTEQSQEPKLGLKGQIGEITPLPGGEDTKGRFHGDLIEKKPEGESSEQAGPLDLWRTKETLDDQLTRVTTLLANRSELSNNKDFKDVKSLIEDVWKVIKNPIEPNVVKLQEYISKNLEGTADGTNFDGVSKKKDGKFDGKFGVGTLAGLNKVLEKTEEYIKALENLNKPGETPETLDNVKLKNNDIKVKKGGEVKPEEWLEGLPQGAKVEIKEGQSVDMNNTEPQTITLVVTGLDGKTKEIEAKITVVENVDSDPNKPPQYPQEIVDNNGVKHPILPESQTITQNLKLNGAALYSVEQSGGLAPDEHEYIMKLGNNPENVYKIKVDKDGLCPTAENFNSKVKILFKNNPACMSYLQAKAPEGAKIGWHNGLQDYTITLNGGKTLTIEPMTIDGKWVSPDLKQCLALLNFTNFLTSAGKIDDIDFKNKNDPDLKLGDDGKLYVRVNKKEKWGEDGKGGEEGKGWYPVPMERFGLVGIDQNVLKKFIKYNNGEDWNDNWDKIDDNKGYKKIDFPVAVREGTADRNGGAGLIGGGEGIIDPTLTQGRVVRGTEAPRVTEGEKISLDENMISKLNVDVLENSADIVQKFAIPENAVVYKAKDSDTYYYKEGNDVVCIGLQPGQEWKKWILGGEEGNSEDINVCPEGKNKLNSILEEGLGELLANNLVTDEEKKLISITIVDGKYTFVNGEKKFPINDNVLKKIDFCKNNDASDIKDKLKLVYLTSKYVPVTGELKLDNDGNIVGKDCILISSKDLLDYGLDNDEAKNEFADYVELVSLNMFGDEDVIPTSVAGGDVTREIPAETAEVKSYGSIGEAVENGKIKNDAIREEDGNRYVIIGDKKYVYCDKQPDDIGTSDYCIQYEDGVYFGKLNPSTKERVEGGQFVDKNGKITSVEATSTATRAETGTHDTPETPVAELDLSQYRNSDSKIDLSFLPTLTKAQAEILATTSGTLILNGLKTIDTEIAEELNKHEGFLSLNGLEDLSKDVADKFKNRKSTMSFDSIKKFEQGVSEFIGTSEGGLSLAGLEEISIEDAKNIGNHKGIMIHENDSFNNTITLSSLKHITAEQAKLLGKFEGEIQLNGLESLDEQTAKELANSQLSQIYFDNPEFDKLVREINPDKIPQYVDMGR